MGTPAYMAPEQAAGDVAAIGPATDIYALGTILYELLTGRLPFEGTVFERIRHVIATPPRPPSALLLGLDPRLDHICLKALAKRPADRFASCQEFADALRAFLRPALHPAAPAAASPSLKRPAPAQSARPGFWNWLATLFRFRR